MLTRKNLNLIVIAIHNFFFSRFDFILIQFGCAPREKLVTFSCLKNLYNLFSPEFSLQFWQFISFPGERWKAGGRGLDNKRLKTWKPRKEPRKEPRTQEGTQEGPPICFLSILFGRRWRRPSTTVADAEHPKKMLLPASHRNRSLFGLHSSHLLNI